MTCEEWEVVVVVVWCGVMCECRLLLSVDNTGVSVSHLKRPNNEYSQLAETNLWCMYVM